MLAGGGIWAPTPASLSPALSLDVAFLLQEHWRIALTGSFSFGGSVPVFDENGVRRGVLSSQTILAAPSVSWCTATRLRACGGIFGGARFSSGSTSGDLIFQTNTRWLGSPVVGPFGQLAFSASRFTAALDVGLLVNPVSSGFALEGLAARIDTPFLEVLARLSIGFGVDR